MLPAKRKHEPIRQSVHVDCSIEDAFRLFTEGFNQWWPSVLYSLTDAEAKHCDLEPWLGGRVFERTNSGEEHDWGSIIDWDPPERLCLSWHPGGPDDRRQTVDVQFEVDAQGTRVTLIHTGWETSGVAVCSLPGGYPEMWSLLLISCFSEFVSEQRLVAA
jgi:uncharacterized protein YndB with AHSA1/START domain